MRRRAIVIGLIIALGAELGPSVIESTIGWPKLLLWNASASAPIGLYLLRSSAPLRVGELVAVIPPVPLAHFMAARGYLPIGVPLLKHIGALGGQSVCRKGRTITINGAVVAMALDHDSHGHALPNWQGCRSLGFGEIFLLNRTVPASFDGRYFGALPVTAVTARAIPLWTFKEPR